MKTIVNFLLIGNSRLHWAFKKDFSYKFFHTLNNETLPENIDLKNLIWASVGKYPTDKFLKRNEVKLEDINLKNVPNNLGVDRALVSFAALKKFKNKLNKNILIADLGTTVSITKISNKGNILGGQLFPGFTTQLKAMELNTKNLLVPDQLFIPNNHFELSTTKAMLRGVYNSIVGAIDSSFNRDEDILILCGGDSEFVGESMRKKIKNIIIEPDLVMHGMIFLNENRTFEN